MTKPSREPPPGPREQIIESAIALMRRSGLSGAGINQILAHSKAPKGSLYHYFPGGKVQIATEALSLYGERVGAMMEQVLSGPGKPADKIRALFRAIAQRLEEGDFDQSCAAGAVALDLEPEVAAVRPAAEAAMTAWRDVIARHVPMRTRARTLSFAGLVVSAIEGGYVRGRAERSTAPLPKAGGWLAALAQSETDG